MKAWASFSLVTSSAFNLKTLQNIELPFIWYLFIFYQFLILKYFSSDFNDIHFLDMPDKCIGNYLFIAFLIFCLNIIKLYVLQYMFSDEQKQIV